jgi:hypothetical protein
MEHLVIIAVMALVPMGAWLAMSEGMVLGWMYNFLDWLLPPILAKPLVTCKRCMCSAWGIPSAFLVVPNLDPWLLPVYLLAAVGLQEAIDR